ncbi:MAG: hypothetical protein PVG65_05300 [Candidatus Thorarchaeota archaeon]
MTEEKKELMLIEAMKKLRIIEKKINTNTNSINRYASMVSTEKPSFDNEGKQQREINALIQSNEDLMEEYLILKKRIEYTNLFTTVEMHGRKYSISELLVIRRKLANLMVSTYNALNDREGQSRLQMYQRTSATASDSERPRVVKLYKEEMKNEGLKKWQDLYDNIDSRLEVINATTPLMNLPS